MSNRSWRRAHVRARARVCDCHLAGTLEHVNFGEREREGERERRQKGKEIYIDRKKG